MTLSIAQKFGVIALAATSFASGTRQAFAKENIGDNKPAAAPTATDLERQSIETFKKALAFVLDAEGGYVNDPVDRGGATFKGVSTRAYDEYLAKLPEDARKGMPKDVKELSELADKNRRDQIVEDFYLVGYWKTGKCPEICRINPAIAFFHFDRTTNFGVGGAAETLQTAVKVDPDRSIGPITLAAVAALAPEKVINEYAEESNKRYEAIASRDKSQVRFLGGWRDRVSKLRTAALALIRATGGSETKAAPESNPAQNSADLAVLKKTLETKKVLFRDNAKDSPEAVKALQRLLNAVMPDKEPKLKVHGKWEAETDQALEEFQIRRDLPHDRIYGPKTDREIELALAGKPPQK